MSTVKGLGRKFYAVWYRLRRQYDMLLFSLTLRAKRVAKNKAIYEDYNYCMYTFAKLSKQLYDGKDIGKTKIALIELYEGIKRDGDFKIESYLGPSIRAVLGQSRFEINPKRSVVAPCTDNA